MLGAINESVDGEGAGSGDAAKSRTNKVSQEIAYVVNMIVKCY